MVEKPAMGEKENICPWCGEKALASQEEGQRHEGNYGVVVERRCGKCDKVVAAYLEGEGNFLPKIRTF